MIFPNTNPEYGRVVFGSARLELHIFHEREGAQHYTVVRRGLFW